VPDHDSGLEHLAAQVDQALADVRRSEHVTPATQLALLVGGLPMVLLLAAIAIRVLT
jgi:hypothetical protein